MKPIQLLQVFWARRGLLCGVTVAVVLATLLISILMPPSYVAETSLIVDMKNNAEVLNAAQAATQQDAGYMATQVDVISSHNVAVKVVDALKLTEDPEWQEDFRTYAHGEGVMREWIADRLLDKLNVKPSRESSVINLTFTSTDPRAAADTANAFANAYIATNLELKMDPARHQAGWFDEQLLGLRKQWEAAQQRLSKYQQENNVVGNDGRLDIENAQLSEISRQLVGAQAAMYAAEARRKQVTKPGSDQSPDVVADALLQNLKADLSRAEGRLADTEKRYGKNHPLYQGAQAEVDNLRQKLMQETANVNGSITQSATIARQHVAELEQALANQRDRILALKQQYDALDVLTREVQGAQKTYEAASQRGSEVRLESQLNQSTIAILNPAVIPRKAARSLLKKLLLATILGGMLGAAAALAVEFADRRVRSDIDVIDGVGLPVIGEFSLGAQPPRLPGRRSWVSRQLQRSLEPGR